MDLIEFRRSPNFVSRDRGATGAEAIGVTTAGILKFYCNLTHMGTEGLPNLLKEDSRKDQAEDIICCLTLKALESGCPELPLATGSPKEA